MKPQSLRKVGGGSLPRSNITELHYHWYGLDFTSLLLQDSLLPKVNCLLDISHYSLIIHEHAYDFL